MDSKYLNKMIEITKLLECLTVSLDRMGSWTWDSQADLNEELYEFFSPDMYKRISECRCMCFDLMEKLGPEEMEKLEKLCEYESPSIGYWLKPKHKPKSQD